MDELSQVAIDNINDLLNHLRGNKDCDIYSVDELVDFINQSLSIFNETPPFTSFAWDDTSIIKQIDDVLVQGSIYLALATKSRIIHNTSPTIDRLIDAIKVIKKEVIS
jgi:hypothetical protein